MTIKIKEKEEKTLSVETYAPVPFLSEIRSSEDITVSFVESEQSVNEENSSSLAALVNWKVTGESEDDSSKPQVFCQFELDSEKVFEMKELPVLEVNVSTKDGTRKHSHATILEMGW